MTSIILFNPQSSANSKPILPMSLLAIGAVLEGKHEYTIVDGNLEKDPAALLGAAIESAGEQPVLGVTVMPGPQLEQAVPLCRDLKKSYPHLLIVWGGYFPTQHWQSCLSSSFVDVVIRGHGELAFLEFVDQSMTGKTDLASIPGLAYRDSNGQPVTNSLAAIPHPERLPQWNFERIPVQRYLRNTFLGSHTLGYHSSYGCPFFCNFCAVVNMVNGRWLPQSAKTVADNMDAYHNEWGVNAVEFNDNNFFTSQSRVEEFSDRIMNLDMAWWGEGRVDTLQMYSEKTWRKMRDSGLRMVFMGAESGSNETLKRMRKGGKMSVEKTLEMAKLMRSWNIVPEFSFVLGNPPDPEEDIRQTIAFIRKIKRVNPDTEIIMYLYTPVPLAGDLYDGAKAEGFAFPETLEAWVSADWLDFSQRRSANVPWIKRTARDQILDFERVVNAYYPSRTNSGLTRERRFILRAISSWRYHLQFYHNPLELQVAQKLMAYQRPETSGF
jgi:anaerobic magnesium-protoporphyrin IX monomethyl ester cyclase